MPYTAITATDIQHAPLVRDLVKTALYERDAGGTLHPVDMKAVRDVILKTRPATNDTEWWRVAEGLVGLYRRS